MNPFIIYIALFIFPFFVWGQNGPQEDYLNSKPKQQEFSPKHWKKIKKTMLKEARGNAKAKGEEFKRSDFESNQQEASYYEYEQEAYNGEYAQNNGERPRDYEVDDYEYNQEYKHGEGEEFSYYESKERDVETGEYYSKRHDQNYTPSSSRNNSSSYNGEGIGSLGSVLLYTLLAVFLGFIIYILFINTTISDEGKSIKEVKLEKAPVEIAKSELELMLEKALANKDYRLAVRIYFIFVLKDLSEKKWITWKKEKTNISYLMEMRGKKQYELFNESVSIFELVWYGNYTITDKDYDAIEPKFKTLLKELATK
ncbi:MAG: hypothetical protein N4A35_10515 [Flavobacteriales bacterium]|jgi:hypothetical protein|nr:hypothetical protein [Flavobacteriales bacterium]